MCCDQKLGESFLALTSCLRTRGLFRKIGLHGVTVYSTTCLYLSIFGLFANGKSNLRTLRYYSF